MSDKKQSRADLLWDCFVNWAETLEKIKEAERRTQSPEDLKPMGCIELDKTTTAGI